MWQWNVLWYNLNYDCMLKRKILKGRVYNNAVSKIVQFCALKSAILKQFNANKGHPYLRYNKMFTGEQMLKYISPVPSNNNIISRQNLLEQCIFFLKSLLGKSALLSIPWQVDRTLENGLMLQVTWWGQELCSNYWTRSGNEYTKYSV